MLNDSKFNMAQIDISTKPSKYILNMNSKNIP
jgi:hypothetical protein